MNRFRIAILLTAMCLPDMVRAQDTHSFPQRCHRATLLDVDSRAELVPTVSTQHVEKKDKHGKTTFDGYSTPSEEKHTIYTVRVALDGMIYTAESTPRFGIFSYKPTDLVVGDPIEACVDGNSIALTRRNGKQFKAKIVRTARETQIAEPGSTSLQNVHENQSDASAGGRD